MKKWLCVLVAVALMASLSAVMAEEEAKKDTTFHDGLAIYQMTEAGLMANADISGTKYWKNKKLNAE